MGYHFSRISKKYWKVKSKALIEFDRFELENGLRVIVHEDRSTPMVAVNVLYDVGSRDESPDKTGFAHLFEHLMFGGSANIPNFDVPIQTAGGENNAFTNNDITNFYTTLPSANIETAFWLESDRMMSLNFSKESLEVQRKVVLEEFKETCLNQPYGDAWHHIANTAYRKHPYQWPTIGKVPKHVEDATLEDVKDFFFKYYRPNNAILTVSGDVTVSQIKDLGNKWFGSIPRGKINKRKLPKEPIQRKFQEYTRTAKVPIDALYLAFHIVDRRHQDYYTTDLISDVLSNGSSSRLYRRLLKEQRLFSSIDAYVTGNVDPGLLIIEGKPAEGVSLEKAESAIWKELRQLRRAPLPEQELLKYKHKVESSLAFSEVNILNKAINLAFFELLGDANLVNDEGKLYSKVTTEDIQRVAKTIFTKSNCSKIRYMADKES